jgi:hypothetical protein
MLCLYYANEQDSELIRWALFQRDRPMMNVTALLVTLNLLPRMTWLPRNAAKVTATAGSWQGRLLPGRHRPLPLAHVQKSWTLSMPLIKLPRNADARLLCLL